MEWKKAVVDLSTDLTSIEGVACLVKGVYINTVLSAHVCPIKDATESTYVIPAGATAANRYDFGPTRFPLPPYQTNAVLWYAHGVINKWAKSKEWALAWHISETETKVRAKECCI